MGPGTVPNAANGIDEGVDAVLLRCVLVALRDAAGEERDHAYRVGQLISDLLVVPSWAPPCRRSPIRGRRSSRERFGIDIAGSPRRSDRYDTAGLRVLLFDAAGRL
ncbi:hypothetical protein [Streptomyces sp. NBC_01022]|uniref:hypothetical protein n=1 Tax=Streptomyces sp. NBC_01022 TaxID=2903723 RepID=UPI002DDC52F2|nr:hypothetical protein [Streptomyces sp. NBC_01022]WRZ80258.1 hypothetical protein OG316_08300 [Streptomyces sp. NBC_01022]